METFQLLFDCMNMLDYNSVFTGRSRCASQTMQQIHICEGRFIDKHIKKHK